METNALTGCLSLSITLTKWTTLSGRPFSPDECPAPERGFLLLLSEVQILHSSFQGTISRQLISSCFPACILFPSGCFLCVTHLLPHANPRPVSLFMLLSQLDYLLSSSCSGLHQFPHLSLSTQSTTMAACSPGPCALRIF